MTALGQPVWTTGHFERIAAQDDLGIEAAGAGLLRELIPGVVQTSISAGYYAYYPFLLQEFENRFPNEFERTKFRAFYRRQEAAFAVATSQHQHRGNLRGINGINAALQSVEDAHDTRVIDVAALAAPGKYMKTPLGGYGLFYRPALEDIGATRLGKGRLSVDRTTDAGDAASEGFRETIQQTEYWQRWGDEDVVPLGVLEELGEAVCPCQIPGRSDQQPIIDLLFGNDSGSERWRTLRKYRVQSFGLLLEFQSARPEGIGDIGEWRRALISGRIGTTPWATAFGGHRQAWRAYQYRESLVAALTSVFTNLLFVIEDLGSSTPHDAAVSLTDALDWSELGCTRGTTLRELAKSGKQDRENPATLIAFAEAAMSFAKPKSVGVSMAHALSLLIALMEEPAGSDEFVSLLGRGGSDRLSVTHMQRWLTARADDPVEAVAAELTRELFYRHLRIAAAKITPTDYRNPYCVAETTEGSYEVIRGDQPFWTGARFATLNHLLWTIGALDEPDGNGRPTALGLSLLKTTVEGA